MISNANYFVIIDHPKFLVLFDKGPWDQYKTITNAAEKVVIEVNAKYGLNGRRLFYYDSDHELTELVHKDGKFVDFKCASGADLNKEMHG